MLFYKKTIIQNSEYRVSKYSIDGKFIDDKLLLNFKLKDAIIEPDNSIKFIKLYNNEFYLLSTTLNINNSQNVLNILKFDSNL